MVVGGTNAEAFVQIFVGLVRMTKYVDDGRVAIARVRRMPKRTLRYTGTVILKQHIWGLLIGSQRQSRMFRPIHMYFYMSVMFGRRWLLFVAIMTAIVLRFDMEDLQASPNIKGISASKVFPCPS